LRILSPVPRRLLGFSIVVMLLGCGSRTGLTVDVDAAAPTARDAGIRDAGGRRDAGFFATFPCRWSLGESVTLAEGDDYVALTGAVHPTLDEALLVATVARTSEVVGAVVSITARPTILRRADEPMTGDAIGIGEVFTGTTGYVQQRGLECGAVALSPTLDALERAEWGPGGVASICQLTQTRPGSLQSVSVLDFGDGAVRAIDDLGPGGFRATEIATTEARLEGATAIREPEHGTTLLLTRRAADVVAERHGPGGVERFPLAGEIVAASAARENLRGGMLMLTRRLDGDWRLDWLPADADPPQSVIDLADLPAPPVGRLVTNETEALVPLQDGSLAYIPLALTELRILPPAVEGVRRAEMQVILRPGGSGGGLLSTRMGRGGLLLEFQSLVCNR